MNGDWPLFNLTSPLSSTELYRFQTTWQNFHFGRTVPLRIHFNHTVSVLWAHLKNILENAVFIIKGIPRNFSWNCSNNKSTQHSWFYELRPLAYCVFWYTIKKIDNVWRYKMRFPSLLFAHLDGKMTERNFRKISVGGERVSGITGSWNACSKHNAICSHGQRHPNMSLPCHLIYLQVLSRKYPAM